MKPAIRVENLSKQYRIGTRTRDASRNLTESIVDGAAALWRGLTGRGRHDDGEGEFWALKDVSFEVQPGEVVGIIGRNGAGKSTLLKILSRIAEPTSGRAVVRGRMGSLLEVGTGFHPELTGRENVFLNGSILGMSRQEINAKFDEIVAFSEIEQFLDTPVKRYSSGMYVRLAFAVAAHLQPDILLVDEVLAVGDASFQRKCLGKMREVGCGGHTVFFVSHNMVAVRALCKRAILVEKGKILADGEPDEAVDSYLAQMDREIKEEYDLRNVARARGRTPILNGVRVQNNRCEARNQIACGEQLVLELHLTFPRRFQEPQIGVGFDDSFGQRVVSVTTFFSTSILPECEGATKVKCVINDLPLAPGQYTLSLSVGNLQNTLIDQVEHVVGLEVVPGDFYRNGRPPMQGLGLVLVRSCWEVMNEPTAPL